MLELSRGALISIGLAIVLLSVIIIVAFILVGKANRPKVELDLADLPDVPLDDLPDLPDLDDFPELPNLDELTNLIGGGGSVEGFSSGGGKTVEYFSMEKCPHCKKFDPLWKAVSDKVQGSDARSSIKMKKWDVLSPEGRKRAEEEGVSAFPHVQKSEDGAEAEVFEGDRTEKDLTDFVMA